MHLEQGKPSAHWLQNVNAKIKLGGTVLLVCAIALLPRRVIPLYIAPALVVLILWVIARMPVFYTLKRLLVAQLFIGGIAVLWLFSPRAGPLLVSVFIKSNLSILVMLVLAWTTPFHEILLALRSAGMPAVMLTTLALMYRYLPVLTEESRRMQRARASRTFSTSHRLGWQNLAQIIARLFLRSLERAERIYLAMCARGWR